MEFSIHTIKPTKSSKRSKKRVGRGNATGKGTYSGRGLKGQRSRSGGKSGTKRRGLKASLQKMPKSRGFNSLQAKKETVTLATLERICKENDVVSPAFLDKKGVIKKPQNGIKIVATGTISKKLKIEHCLATKKAVELIEKAGGTITF